MLKNHVVCLFVLALALLGAAPVWALSAGGGFSVGSGESKLYRESMANSNYFNSDYENTSSIGGGLVIDAGDPKNAYFTRYIIGLDYHTMETGYTKNITRFNFSTTFCFVVAQKDFFRFWLGPQLGVHYMFGKTRYSMYDHDPALLFVLRTVPQLISYYRTAKYNMGGADAGLVVGFDFDIKQYVTISVSLGVKYGATVGGIAFRDGGLFKNNYLAYSHGFDRFADIGVLYRFDDSRAQKQAEGAKT